MLGYHNTANLNFTGAPSPLLPPYGSPFSNREPLQGHARRRLLLLGGTSRTDDHLNHLKTDGDKSPFAECAIVFTPRVTLPRVWYPLNPCKLIIAPLRSSCSLTQLLLFIFLYTIRYFVCYVRTYVRTPSFLDLLTKFLFIFSFSHLTIYFSLILSYIILIDTYFIA